ncbi:MAG: hypothetical protein ACE366_26565 [Bradymonadia bacterium]
MSVLVDALPWLLWLLVVAVLIKYRRLPAQGRTLRLRDSDAGHDGSHVCIRCGSAALLMKDAYRYTCQGCGYEGGDVPAPVQEAWYLERLRAMSSLERLQHQKTLLHHASQQLERAWDFSHEVPHMRPRHRRALKRYVHWPTQRRRPWNEGDSQRVAVWGDIIEILLEVEAKLHEADAINAIVYPERWHTTIDAHLVPRHTQIYDMSPEAAQVLVGVWQAYCARIRSAHAEEVPRTARSWTIGRTLD